ncbi:quinone oxidoreductase family protein [Anditalea andensis]|uniref:Alcohol dehydrogenase n=1 Tax=Anditalea andensis TaxID=1048983 RepID=A0A074KV44_9BACT|nr:zinc-binding dehydrogenase [Anditalea andensis]KEO73856.1 alcohol dehydrogenase [Anditalea andensis]
MKGIILTDENPDKIAVKEVDLGDLGADEVKVRIHAAALNHRDQWCREGRYPNIKNGIILGSDGAGEVVEVGAEVSPIWLGKQVIMNAAMGWGTYQKAQSSDFKIMGMPTHGTLAQYVHIKADRLMIKPDHLNMEEAAGLPLAGVTAYRALFYHGQVSPGDKVLITGFGGGVSQLAAQIALKAGAVVFVTSGIKKKLQVAYQYGVEEGFIYHDPDWADQAKKASGGFDLIVDSAVGDTLDTLIPLLIPGGKLVVYGATLGNPSKVDMRRVFWNQITIQGTTMGSDEDFKKMVEYVNVHKITPIIDSVYPLADAVQAFDKMKEGTQMGKIIIRLL